MDNQPSSRERRRWVVVSYDIPDDKRRTKVMKIVEGYGERAQYNVFECVVRPADLRELRDRLQAVIQDQDDVRFYLLCDACLADVIVLGKATLHRPQAYVVI